MTIEEQVDNFIATQLPWLRKLASVVIPRLMREFGWTQYQAMIEWELYKKRRDA